MVMIPRPGSIHEIVAEGRHKDILGGYSRSDSGPLPAALARRD